MHKYHLQVTLLKVHSIENVWNYEYCSNTSVIVFNDTEDVPRCNFTVMIKAPIMTFKTFITIKVKSFNERAYDRLLLETSLDSCNVQKGVLGNFLVKALIKNLKDYSNFKFECPQPAGFIYTYNFPIAVLLTNVPRSFLGPLTGNRILFEAVMDTKARIAKSKPLVRFTTWKLYGLLD